MGLLDAENAQLEQATPRVRERGRDDQRIRSAQEAKPKDVYYRPEYGWIMSNADVAREEAIKGQYDKAAGDVAAGIADQERQYRDALAHGETQINSAYSDAVAGAQNPANVPLYAVRVVNGNNIEGTYMLPKSVIDEMNQKSFNQGDGSYTGNWVDDGKFYNVDVRARGIGPRGQELHDAMRETTQTFAEAQAQNQKLYEASLANANKEREAALSGFNEASQKNYDGARSVWDAELSRLTGGYAERVSQGKAAYQEKKKKYNESVMNMNAGLLESPTNQVRA
jgi:hypothetical protein